MLCAAMPAAAQQSSLSPALVTTRSLPASPAVEIYYRLRSNAPIWLRDASTREAARLLPRILERSTLDGLADGPDLALMVEAALDRASNPPFGTRAPGSPDPFLAEEKLISAAWVQYVRALKAPAAGMVYGDPALIPQPPKPDRVLIDAAKAPSLLEHVRAVAAVNPIYADLRAAAAAQSGGSRDPRLAANLERARVLPSAGRYIVVNAASAELTAYEDGKVQDRMKVVVGKPGTPTPMLAGTIHYVTFNPYWNIPTDVAARVVAPLVLKRGVSYLRAARYEVASDWTSQATVLDPASIDWKAVAAGTAEVRLRQLPGPANMMGAMKFGFVNDLGIYLHDTPHKELLTKAKRNFSLGCVRVEDAARLARWLLGKEPAAPSAEPEQFVQLDKGVPIYITYLTAVPRDGGELAFLDDVYKRDPRIDPGLTDVRLADASAKPGEGLLVTVPASSAEVPVATRPAGSAEIRLTALPSSNSTVTPH